jgi:RHS repeat-associated protein
LNPYVAAQYQQLPGAAQASAAWFNYDKNGNLTSKYEYDWVTPPTAGSAPPSPCTVTGTALRHTENQFWDPPGGAGSVAHAADTPTLTTPNAYWAAAAFPKRDSLLETRVYPGSQISAPAIATTAVNLTSANAAGTQRTFGSNAHGLVAIVTDPSGNQTSYSYGLLTGSACTTFSGYYPTTISGPLNLAHTYDYDCATGALNDVWSTNNQNLQTKYGYDAYGRVTSEVDGSGLSGTGSNTSTITTTYDDANRVVTTTQDSLLGSVNQFNQLGQRYLARQNPDTATSAITATSTSDIRAVTVDRTGSTDGSVPATHYTLRSNPYLSTGSGTEPTLGWTLLKYDQAGRVSDIYYYSGQGKPSPFGTNGSQTAHEYYTYSGTSTTSYDANSNYRTTTVDALGRIQSASDAASSATYSYDTLDNLSGVTQSDSTTYSSTVTQTRTFGYSSLSRLVSATNPESGTTTYTYWPDGALHTKTDGRNLITTYTVDGLDRVLKKDYSTTTPVTPAARFCYDGQQYSVSSDSCTATPNRKDYAQGSLTDSAAKLGGAIVSETQYTNIDGLGHVLASQQMTAGLATMPFHYNYGAGGFLTGVQYPSGRWVSYSATGANRVAAVQDGQSGSSYYLQSATYKPNGSLAGAAMGWDPTNASAVTWNYNSRLQAHSLTAMKGTTKLLGLNWVYSATYDSNYNETGTDNNGNLRYEVLQYPSGGATQNVLRNYSYDGANRLSSYSEPSASQSFGYDGLGNLWQSGTAVGVPSLLQTSSSAYLFTGNQVTNQMKGVGYDAAGNQTQLSSTQTAKYDAENRMAELDASGVAIATYVYDGEGRRVEREMSNTNIYYVYDAGGELMAEYGGQPSGTGTQYVVTDQLGSTRMVLDANGVCQQRIDYAPYGGQVVRSGQDCYQSSATVDTPLFTGQYRDGETANASTSGIDYFGARYFSSAQGRWTSVDPAFESAILELPQTWNRYSYVYNRPTFATDPDGRCPPCVGAIVGGIVEGGWSLGSQLIKNGGNLSDVSWGEVGANVLGGATAGALTVATGGASLLGSALLGDAVAGAGASAAGGIVTRAHRILSRLGQRARLHRAPGSDAHGVGGLSAPRVPLPQEERRAAELHRPA